MTKAIQRRMRYALEKIGGQNWNWMSGPESENWARMGLGRPTIYVCADHKGGYMEDPITGTKTRSSHRRVTEDEITKFRRKLGELHLKTYGVA